MSLRGPPVTTELLQQTAAKVGLHVPDHIAEDFTSMLASGREAMEEVAALDGAFMARSQPVRLFSILHSFRFPSACKP